MLNQQSITCIFQMFHLFCHFVVIFYQFIALTCVSLTINLFLSPHQCQVTLIHRFKKTFFIIFNFQSMNMLLQSLAFTHVTLTWLTFLLILVDCFCCCNMNNCLPNHFILLLHLLLRILLLFCCSFSLFFYC